MTPLLLAAAVFGAPVTDAELAAAVPFAGRAILPSDLRLLGPGPLVIQEQVDGWWAEDGAAAIAQAVRPRPALPAGIDPQMLPVGRFAIRFERNMSATTP